MTAHFSATLDSPGNSARRRAGLLVSVRSAGEAEAAIAGGADLIDVKEPAYGSLGRAKDETIAAGGGRVARRRAGRAGPRGVESRPFPSPGRRPGYPQWGLD